MKKIFTLLLIMVMSLSFAACGNDSTKNQSADDTENELSANAEEKAKLINVCEGNLYAAMPEEDAIAYVENELGLTKTDYIVNGERFTNAFYEISDVKGLGKTEMTLSFDEGLLYYIDFYFPDASWENAMAVVNERLGDDFITENNDSYTRYNWEYDDASMNVYHETEKEDPKVVLYVNYNMEYQY